jgi:hypothetical protein
MTMPEPYDLNEKLAFSYMGWKDAYLALMPQPEGISQADYTDKMCCIAFMEGAKTMQALLNQALLDILAERGK